MIPKLSATDKKLLRPGLMMLVLTLVFSTTIYQGLSFLEQSSQTELIQARASLQQVNSSIEQIEQEEATVVTYMGRYFDIQARGLLTTQDRLQLLETLDNVRQRWQLFPVSVQVGEPVEIEVMYPPEDPLPGDPVFVASSRVSLNMLLLHEGDLIRILASFSQISGFTQPVLCVIRPGIGGTAAFDTLRENFQSQCEFRWYTLSTRAPQPEEF